MGRGRMTTPEGGASATINLYVYGIRDSGPRDWTGVGPSGIGLDSRDRGPLRWIVFRLGLDLFGIHSETLVVVLLEPILFVLALGCGEGFWVRSYASTVPTYWILQVAESGRQPREGT